MKPVTKILIGIVGLITLIPIRLGIQSWFGQSDICEFFGFKTLTPDLEKLFIVTGGFVLTLAVFQILTIVWIIKRKADGFVMSALVGYISVFRGIIMFFLLDEKTPNNVIISFVPIVFGILIVILTGVASEKEKLS